MNNIQTTTECPLVSVIIPAYNAEAFIERTIESVLGQTYTNLEVVVVDDGSTDRTAEIVQSLAQTDSRLTFIQQPNSGVAAARNLAIEKSCGELIAPIDADDIWHPTNIAKQVQCMLRSPQSVGVVYAWSADIDEKDNLTGEFRASLIAGNVYLALICHNFLGNSSSSLIRRSAIETVGGYTTQLLEQNAQGCEDWELYLRLAESYEYRVVPELLVGYRKISSSMSCSYQTMAKSHALMLQAVKIKYPTIPDFLYWLSSSSFYLHLARQSNQNNDVKNTLFWLKRSILAEPLTPFLRIGSYTLFLKSVFRLLLKNQTQSAVHLGNSKIQDKPNHTISEIGSLQSKLPNIWIKLLVSWLVYHSTKILFMLPQNDEKTKYRRTFKTLL